MNAYAERWVKSVKDECLSKLILLCGAIALILLIMKLTVIDTWSWWRVILTLGLFVGFAVTKLVVAFIYLSFVHIPERPGGDEDAILEPHTINAHHIADMLFFVVFGDNMVRLIEGSETGHWFWLFSGKGEIVVVFGSLMQFRCEAGNASDSCTHQHTWDALCRAAGQVDFLYVADSKLCAREPVDQIDQRGSRFVGVMPHTRQEDSEFRNGSRPMNPNEHRYGIDPIPVGGVDQATVGGCFVIHCLRVKVGR